MQTYMFVASLIHISLFASILYYLHRMKVEKCQCALNRSFDILYRTTAILLVLRVVLFALELFFNLRKTLLGKMGLKYLPLIFTYVAVLMLVHIIYFVLSVRYIHALYRDACKCSDNSLRMVYYIYSILMAIILSFLFVFLLGMWQYVSKLSK